MSELNLNAPANIPLIYFKKTEKIYKNAEKNKKNAKKIKKY
jgi:hypothetical protein